MAGRDQLGHRRRDRNGACSQMSAAGREADRMSSPSTRPTAVASSAAVSERMSRARRTDTGPERALRSALHRRGLRYRLHVPLAFDQRRKADICFSAARVAVFVDGCFWHSCPEHATWPKANEEFWRDKLQRNAERDADTDARLAAEGWLAIRVWEHEDPEAAATRVESTIRSRTSEELSIGHRSVK